MKKLFASLGFVLMMLTLTTSSESQTIFTNEAFPGLRETVILIVRHAEKPADGSGLSPAGVQRAAAYVNYFTNFTIDSQVLHPDFLIATADSEKSARPRLTLEPLAHALNLKIDDRFKNKKVADAAQELRSKNHGKCILIAWHHEKIADLLRELGADPDLLLPNGKWPDAVFNWIVELRYDHDGRLIPGSMKRINEKLLPGDAD